ncbi:hypothetical protein N0M98_14470 [Paenibacillus doosanensis]|nr:hypothetical protein [Paenibacillus doosanensis]MCS7461353.1 hypothetical protein [Paenibacillus doosanensis]
MRWVPQESLPASAVNNERPAGGQQRFPLAVVAPIDSPAACSLFF